MLCVDEQSAIQALDRTQPLLPMRPGQPAPQPRPRRGVHRWSGELEGAIRRYIDTVNDGRKPFRWIRSADATLATIQRFASATPDAAGHQTACERVQNQDTRRPDDRRLRPTKR